MLALQHGVDIDDPNSWPAIFLAGLDEPEEHDDDDNSEDDNSEQPTKVKAVEPDSDSDLEPERSLDLPLSFPVLPIQNFQRPHATGPTRPPYELLDSLPFEQGRSILQFVDYVYPRHKHLKGGITVYLLAVDYKTDYVMFRALASKEDTVAAFESIIIERGWHKLKHTTHVVSDGEPKLHAEIATACRRMGLSHSTSVPNQPQSNRAGGNIVRNLRCEG